MRNLDDPDLVRFVVPLPYVKDQTGKYSSRFNAAMEIPCGVHRLRVIASRGGGWDHVSVSLANRTPTWAEMEYVKRLLFKDDEVAMQLHVPVKDHINNHPYTLHLWRPHGKSIPLPPHEYV